MGNCCCMKILKRRAPAINTKKVTLLILGLDGAGKTTIVKRLLREPVDNVPTTIGFATYDLQVRGCAVSIYDLGGGSKIRNIWKQYYQDVHGLIFVVDSKDTPRIDEARKILTSVLKHDKIAGKPVLLLANKQDLNEALDELDIVEKLQLEALVNQQKCPTLVELCSAKSHSNKMDISIDNGFKWLIRYITKEYPTLNNRVLAEMAAQEELDRVAMEERRKRIELSRAQRDDGDVIIVEDTGDPFQPISQILVKPHQNGGVKHVSPPSRPSKNNLSQSLPEVVDCIDGSPVQVSKSDNSIMFFKSEDWGSTAGLLENVSNGGLHTLLQRPKSSGGNLDFSKKQKKKRKRLRLKANNKTAPAPMMEFPKPISGPIPAVFETADTSDVTPFDDDDVVVRQKKIDSKSEVILDVSQL